MRISIARRAGFVGRSHAGRVKYALIICDDESVPESAAEVGHRPDHKAWLD